MSLPERAAAGQNEDNTSVGSAAHLTVRLAWARPAAYFGLFTFLMVAIGTLTSLPPTFSTLRI